MSSSAPADLLRKQLLASEYNLANQAYLNGDATLTRLFIYWGEFVLEKAATTTAAELIFAKDWFEAYNASHGGLVKGPKL
jgi:hypothetical protein